MYSRSSRRRCSVKKGFLEISQISQEKFKKETLAQVFSCEFCEISKNTFLLEYLRVTNFRASSVFLNWFPERWISKGAFHSNCFLKLFALKQVLNLVQIPQQLLRFRRIVLASSFDIIKNYLTVIGEEKDIFFL